MSFSIGDSSHNFLKFLGLLKILLQKDIPFVFDDDCLEAFEKLEKALITAPIVQPPDWICLLKLCVMLVIMLLVLF